MSRDPQKPSPPDWDEESPDKKFPSQAEGEDPDAEQEQEQKQDQPAQQK